MLEWFKDNIYELNKLSFAMGAAENEDEWSDYVWYINLLGENNVDEVFYIKDICKAAVKVADKEIYYGNGNGGTTIQLPFGFVQWHQSRLQEISLLVFKSFQQDNKGKCMILKFGC